LPQALHEHLLVGGADLDVDQFSAAGRSMNQRDRGEGYAEGIRDLCER
jgi:hypothetical protein